MSSNATRLVRLLGGQGRSLGFVQNSEERNGQAPLGRLEIRGFSAVDAAASISTLTGRPENPLTPSLLRSGFRGLLSGCRRRSRCRRLRRNIRDRLPSRYALQNAIRIADRRDVAVIVLDHLDRSAHLLSEPVDVGTFHKSESRVGVAERIRASTLACGAEQQVGLPSLKRSSSKEAYRDWAGSPS